MKNKVNIWEVMLWLEYESDIDKENWLTCLQQIVEGSCNACCNHDKCTRYACPGILYQDLLDISENDIRKAIKWQKEKEKME